jgi:hypothetical protein
MADMQVSKTCGRNLVRVQVPPRPPEDATGSDTVGVQVPLPARLAKLGHLYVVLARQSGTTGEDPDVLALMMVR